ncbi:phage protease [Methylosinus sp. KRF6]|uniref:phage protease n=1 Tax=Methylosinus sp. KRF6 TaxID=2846853 RepID=UPI001C0D40B7|nr:phage protease [Methylosinus sp. KRF6]MBU3889855.1 phage protease [Methylosinus sp. KRF6]
MTRTRPAFQKPNAEIALCGDASPVLEGEALALAAEGGAPEWAQLLPKGPDIVGRDGRRWKLPDAGALVAAFNSRKGPLPIDWEHGQDRLAPQGHPAPAAGWIEALEVRGGELWGRVGWTAKAKAAIEAREYRFLSPTFLHNRASGEIVSLAGAGLVNRPNLEMVALNAVDERQSDLRAALSDALDVAADAAPADFVAAIERLKTAAATNSADLSLFVPCADFDAMSARALNAEKAIEDAVSARREAEIERLVSEAMSAGKVTPATKDYHLASCRAEGGVERFKAFVSDMPSLFGVSNIGKQSGGPQSALAATERAIVEQMNINAEDYLAVKEAERAK